MQNKQTNKKHLGLKYLNYFCCGKFWFSEVPFLKRDFLQSILTRNGCVWLSAVVDTKFIDIYVNTKNIPTCRYNIQHIDKRTMKK